MSPPARSSSMNWNPPVGLSPRIGGSPKANVKASGTPRMPRCAVRPESRRAAYSFVVRSSQGFRVVMTVATLELEVPVAISRPPSTKYLSTPGSLPITASILRGGGVGAVRRGAIRQPHGDEERALIFARQEARRQVLEKPHGEQRHDAAAPAPPAPSGGSGNPLRAEIAVGGPFERAVEPGERAREPGYWISYAAAAAWPPVPGSATVR